MNFNNGRKRLAVFASGQGSNLQNIHEQIALGRLRNVDVSLVLSNRSRSGAMEFANTKEIPSVHYSSLTCDGSEDGYDRGMLKVLQEHQIDVIMLAGYLKKLPAVVVKSFENRILNVHPALLPAFGGANMYGDRVHERVLALGCKVSGATVHLVTSEYDTGPIVLQQCCPVYETDSIEDLRQRVGAIEFEIVPRAIDLLVHDKLRVEQERVYISD